MRATCLLVHWALCAVTAAFCRTTIPERLRECYEDGSVVEGTTRLPMNLRVLIDLIQKAEHYAYASLDMRTMSSSLLDRFRFDGIEYNENVFAKDGISPFSGTGRQRAKNEIIEELMPGEHQLFPSDALTVAERCALHRAVSSAIRERTAATDDLLCNDVSVQKISGRSKSDGAIHSVCPVESGVVITPYGTVAPGAVIASVAASLQPQKVAVGLLINEAKSHLAIDLGTPIVDEELRYNEEEVDIIVPRGEMVSARSMWFQSIVDSSIMLNNVWVATLAGDLGEVAIYQGPVVGQKMTVGATGFWNSTMRPMLFYLTEKNGHVDATRAEIIGGIDGLIIANNLQSWIDDFHSLRLSQVLDMYYSYRGVAFDTSVKACVRAKGFEQASSVTTLKEQTRGVAQILAWRNSIAYMSPEAVERMADHAADTFVSYANEYLFDDASCHDPGPRPQLELLLAFDGAWSRDYTADFISVLLEDLDVSMYGSRMGLINGATGEWWVNVTASPSTIYHALSNIAEITWPAQLNCTRVFERVHAYLNATWIENISRRRIGHFGQVVVLLVPRTAPGENDGRAAIDSLRRISIDHPDVRFVYYGSEFYSDAIKQLVLSSQDRLITSLRIDDLTSYLFTVPRTLRPPRTADEMHGTRDQFEDYVAPSRDVTYSLHKHWRNNAKKVVITVHAFGYGSFKVCSWKRWDNNATENGLVCKDLSGHDEISVTDHSDCTEGKECPHTLYRVQNATSTVKCSEMSCKFPDDVRYIIRMENIQYSGSTSAFLIKSNLSFVYYLQFLALILIKMS